MKIEVTVSAARDRQIKTNDEVLVHVDGSDEPIPAVVWQKSALASAMTRTFTVTLLCRNRRIASGNNDASGATPIRGLMRPQTFEVAGKRTWFVSVACIQGDADKGYYAWQVADPQSSAEDQPLDLKRVNLQLGEARKDIFGLLQFRELSTDQTITVAFLGFPQAKTVSASTNATVIVWSILKLEGEIGTALGTDEGRWQTVLAAGVPNDFSGGKAIKTTRRWLLRPGDIVDVQLEPQEPLPGIYVPKKYIRLEGGQEFVFVVESGGAKPVAKRLPVTVVASVGDLHRITGNGISAGVRLITSGVHYLVDGTEIQIFESTQ